MEKHSDMDWTISIYIDPGREMPLVSLSAIYSFPLFCSLSMCVCLWVLMCLCARPAGHCSGTKRKLAKVEPGSRESTICPRYACMKTDGAGPEFSDVPYTKLGKSSGSVERERVSL